MADPARWAVRLVRRAVAVSLTLLRVMIPVLVAVEVARRLGLVPYLAVPLSPVMALVDLPPAMGLVWATAILNNIYGAIAVFGSLAADHPLTAAQATVLGAMILVAHGLPVELRIVQAAGPRLWFQATLRLGGAVVFGLLLAAAFRVSGAYAEPAAVLWTPRPAGEPGVLGWVAGEARNLGMIFLVILGLLAFLDALEAVRATRLLNRLLGPVLGLVGIGPRAAPLTVVGLTMGIAYGGGLIIHEARSGDLPERDVFHSLSLLGLCHSVFEDSLLLVVIGGRLSGLLWARIAFSLLAIAVLARLTRVLPPSAFRRLFWKPPATS